MSVHSSKGGEAVKRIKKLPSILIGAAIVILLLLTAYEPLSDRDKNNLLGGEHLIKKIQVKNLTKEQKDEFIELDTSSENRANKLILSDIGEEAAAGREPTIKVDVDLAAEKQEQKSVDAGHSPWKLDPAFVAQVFASLLLSPEGITGEYPIPYEEIEITANNGIDATAEIKSTNSIAKYVYLKRLVRQDDTGIWTVVGYDPVN
jgi:hypothetical protein